MGRSLLLATAVLFTCLETPNSLAQPLDSAGSEGIAEPVRQLVPVVDGGFGLAPRIVNGLPTSGFPAVGLLAATASGAPICTGTLIGCQTFLTAAHCVADQPNPGNYFVFFQHGGFAQVSTVNINPSYTGVGNGHDLAVLRLNQPILGVRAAAINTVARPPVGTEGAIVGFGRTGGSAQVTGIKRFGEVVTAACGPVPAASHVCWRFEAPVGPAGSDSNTCQGDSGGPLFTSAGGAGVISGVTSGGANPSCLSPDLSFDTDVFVDRAWIQTTAGSDLNNTLCGGFAAAGSAQAPILGGAGALSTLNLEDDFSFEVPAGTQPLWVTLNGESASDFDLYVNPGSTATATNNVCSSTLGSSLDGCRISNPTPGTWFVRASRFAGSGLYQVTATLFRASNGGSACVPSANVLCIDDQPGDKRFEVQVAWNRTGAVGLAGAIALSSLGVNRGGLFWIGSASNPEILLKILNGCGVNGNYWVFYSAGTSQGLDITVRDTLNGRIWTSANPNGTLAPPVADTSAFSCN